NETNNILSSSSGSQAPVIETPPVIPPPVVVKNFIDLEPTSLTVTTPSPISSGNMVSLQFVVRNNTALGTQGNWYDYIYLTKDSALNSNAVMLNSVSRSGLQASAAYTQSINVSIPNGVSGKYYLVLFTDGSNSAMDTVRSNNALIIPINIDLTVPPDLVVSNMANLPGVLFAGQQVKIPYTVINSGNGNIKQSQAWNDVISISSSPVGGAGSKTMGSVNRRGELLTGGIYNDSIVANIPPNISGNYYIVIKTDESNRIYEENETNNTKSV